MTWIVHNALTEDYLEKFSKRDGSPVWNTDERKAKWFYTWRELSQAIEICQKFNAECYPEELKKYYLYRASDGNYFVKWDRNDTPVWTRNKGSAKQYAYGDEADKDKRCLERLKVKVVIEYG